MLIKVVWFLMLFATIPPGSGQSREDFWPIGLYPWEIRWADGRTRDSEDDVPVGVAGSGVAPGGPAVQALLRQIQALEAGPGADPATVQEEAFKELRFLGGMGLLGEDGTEVSRNAGLLPYVYESDIVLSENQARLILRESLAAAALGLSPGEARLRVKRKLEAQTERNRWPKAVPYELEGGDAGWRRGVEEGLDRWRRTTCLRFRRVQGGPEERLVFHQGEGCTSFVGHTAAASHGQRVSIGQGCNFPGIVAHEIGHAMGLWHEHSRPDRDDFVTVELGSVPKELRYNFKRAPSGMLDTAVPYDYGSVMHYSSAAFASQPDGAFNPGRIHRSLQPKDAAFDSTMGQRVGLSFLDVKSINAAYCADVCGASGRTDCAHGGYADPRDCARCRCPSGLGGATCEAVAPSEGAECGGELLATSSWQTVASSANASRCHWRIRAPEGGQVFVRVTEATYFRPWAASCSSFLEWKWGADLSQTGGRFCEGRLPDGRWSEGHVVVLTHDTLSDLPTGHGDARSERLSEPPQGRFSARFIGRTATAAATSPPPVTSTAPVVRRCEQTLSGRACQAWAAQSPHSHKYGQLGSKGRACANPDQDQGPWCYTEDSGQRWEFCHADCPTS